MAPQRANQIRFGFSLFICCWVHVLTERYHQMASTHVIRWGMLGYGDRAMTRAQFDPRLRGSLRQILWRSLHWFIVIAFVFQSIGAASYIAGWRRHLTNHPNEFTSVMGLQVSHAFASQLGKYLITANIKVMDLCWGLISPKMTDQENWRTDQEHKNQQVLKTFMVKCIVYYYPFFYLAFVRDFVEGCHESECISALRQNMAVFIITQMATAVGKVLAQVGSTWWTERKLLAKVSKSPSASTHQYTYVQAQALRPAYGGDGDDYLDLTITLGFITMFAVVYPFLSFMALVSTLVKTRVIAFGLCRVTRRPTPQGQEGIGAWLLIVKFLAYVSCVTSVGLLIFSLHPLKDLGTTVKLGSFIISEHAMIALMFVIGMTIPRKSLSDELILEHHCKAEDLILASESRPVEAKGGSLVCLDPDTWRLIPKISII